MTQAAGPPPPLGWDATNLAAIPLGLSLSLSHSADAAAEDLAIGMADAWAAGRRRKVEDVLAEHPEIVDQPRAVVRLIYEEICLRRELNPESLSVEMLGRFPRYHDELKALLDGIRLIDPVAPARAAFPEVGGTLGDARLLAELGRGAQGRVFLATQAGLADRPIVIKVVPLRGMEHLTLARLQHTNIVPLYAAPAYPELNLRALVMPYLGALTLSRLAEALRPIPVANRTGADILAAIDRAGDRSIIDLPREGSTRAWLERAEYTQAVAWIGACLGRALQYAHERRLVHLDLKTSNVLLAVDGQPMLLDFHLARGPISPSDPVPGVFGGTPSAMSPEQADAFRRIQAGQPPRVSVDARSDLYSLGLILFELLGGPTPPIGSPRELALQLRGANRKVSLGLADLIARTLSPDPDGRYPDAAALVDDLRRFLSDQPLRGVTDRDPVERWRRWRRRRPHALAMVIMMIAVGVAVALSVVAARGPGLQPMNLPERQAAARAKRAKNARILAQSVDQIRKKVLGLATPSTPDARAELGKLADVTHELWRERQRFLDSSDGLLSQSVENGIRDDLRAVVALSITLDERARPQEASANRREGLRRIEDAIQEVGSSPELNDAYTRLKARPE